MTWLIVILAAATMLVLAVFMAYVLGWANEAFHVETDERVEACLEALPGANCGGCGFVGCSDYAEAVVAGKAECDRCPVGGPACAKKLAEILGVELGHSAPYRPVVHCGATYEQRLGRHAYDGEPRCTAANLVAGVQGCTYGCLGFGDCERVCEFDAIDVIDGLATVDYAKCVGCGACAKICPRNIIHMVPFNRSQVAAIACSNKDFGKDVKAVCKVGCLGCGACQRLSDLFRVSDNIAHVEYDQLDEKALASSRKAFDKCPSNRIVMVGIPAEKDRAAVADKDTSGVVEAEFETTVDQTTWHG